MTSVNDPEFEVLACDAPAASTEVPHRPGGRARSHHLLKHPLPTWDVHNHFGTTEHKEVAKEITKMGQRELQQKFRDVYGTQTFSNNNNWLRRKLMEAAGVQTPKAQGRGRPSAQRSTNKGAGPRPTAMAAAIGVPGVPPARGSPTSSRSSAEATKHRSQPSTEGLRRTARKCKPSRLNKEMMADTGAASVSSDDDSNPLERQVEASRMRSTNAMSAYQLGVEHARAQVVLGKETTDALADYARRNYPRSTVVGPSPGSPHFWNNGFSSGNPFYSPHMQWFTQEMQARAVRTHAIIQQHGRHAVAHESGESDITIGGMYEQEGEPAVDHETALVTRTSSFESMASASNALLMDTQLGSRPNTALPLHMSADPRYGLSFGMSSEPQTPVGSFAPNMAAQMPFSSAESCSALDTDREDMDALIRSFQPDNVLLQPDNLSLQPDSMNSATMLNIINQKLCELDAHRQNISNFFGTELF